MELVGENQKALFKLLALKDVLKKSSLSKFSRKSLLARMLAKKKKAKEVSKKWNWRKNL